MRSIDVVLDDAKRLAWEGLTDEQRTVYLQTAARRSGREQPMSILRRWAVQTGPAAPDGPFSQPPTTSVERRRRIAPR